jgi:hypothetical protein
MAARCICTLWKKRSTTGNIYVPINCSWITYLYTCLNGMYKLNNKNYSLYRKWNPQTCLVTISTEHTKTDSLLVCYKISAPLGRRNFWHVYVFPLGYIPYDLAHRTEFVTSHNAHRTFTVPSSWRHTMNKKKVSSSIFTTDTRSWSIPDWGVIL